MLRAFFVATLAAALVTGYLLYSAPAPKSVAQQPAAISVSVVPTERRDIPIWLRGIGAVQALNTLKIRSRFDGTLDKVNFKEGQQVRQSDVLAMIDPRLYQAALDQAKLDQDRAQLVSDEKDLDLTMAAMLGGLPLMLGAGTGSELHQPLGFAMWAGWRSAKQSFPKVETGFGIKTLLKQKDLSGHLLAKPAMAA